MKNLLSSSILSLLLLFTSVQITAQVAINTDGSQPDNSAMLDIKATSKGMLVPRMTTMERDAISNPATGLLIFCTTNNQFYSNKGTPSSPNWMMVSSQWVNSGSDLYFSGGKVGIGNLSPGYHLDVSGDINFSGTLRQNGLPVATGVSSVSANSPLISSGGITPNISIPQANATTHGFLSFSDWSIFYNKQNALSFGNVQSGDMTITGGGTVVGYGLNLSIIKGNLISSDLTILGGSGSVLGSGTNLSINKGNITSPDISITGGTGSVLGGGTLLTINKGNLFETSSSVLTIIGGNGAVLGSGASIQVKQSNASQPGYLSSADWNSFNNKVSSQWTTNGTNISYNSGKVGIGITNSDGSAILDVSSTTKGFLPPRMTGIQRNAIDNPSPGLIIFNSETNSLNFFNGMHWVSLPTHYIGEKFGGGIIYYLWKDSLAIEHGLIASLEDLSSSKVWSNVNSAIGSIARSPINGQGNTAAIIGQVGHANSAAKLCDDYSYGGFSDWYLPASWELSILYNEAFIVNSVLENDGNSQTNGLAFYGDVAYWSSTEKDATQAYPHNFDKSLDTFGGGFPWGFNKDKTYRVRAIRRF